MPKQGEDKKKEKRKTTFFANHLQLCQKTLALQEQDNLVNRCPDIGSGQVHSQISIGRHLVRVVNTGEALDLTSARLGVHATLISLLRVLKRGRDVDEVEGSESLHSLAGRLSRVLERSNGRNDCRGTSLGELGGYKGDAGNVLVTVGSAEAELARELAANGVAEEEGDGSTSLLVQGDVESACDGVLARVLVAGQEDGETLLAARRV